MNGANYFAVSTVTQIAWFLYSSATPGFTVQQAYNIDKKIDDGLPMSGSVTACYYNANVGGGSGAEEPLWAAGGNNGGGGGSWSCKNAGTGATSYQSYNCYDNSGTAGTQLYQLQNATVQNCALSFRFQ